jgi:hypothetical protein
MLLQGWRAFAYIALFVWTLFAPAIGSADVLHPDLAKALAYYERGDFQRASADLSSLVEAPFLSREERSRAREALAVSYYVLGRLLDSRKQFTELLKEEKGYQPDPLYVAPEIVAFVADIRRSAEAAALPVTVSTAPARIQDRTAPTALPLTNLPPPLELRPTEFSGLDLLPFGVAQYRKGHTARGVVLSSLQGLFLGANIGLYYYRSCSLKPCDDRYYQSDDLRQAQQLQTMQMVAGSLFIGTVLLGVADGITLMPAAAPQLSIRPVGTGVGLAWETD